MSGPSDDNPREDGPTVPSSPSPDARATRRNANRRRRLPIIAAIAASAVLGILVLRHRGTPPRLPPPSVVASTGTAEAALPMPKPVLAKPAVHGVDPPVAAAPGASAASGATAAPDLVGRAATGLRELIERLLTRSDTIDQRLDHLEADVGEIRHLLESQRPARAAATRAVPAGHRRPAAAASAPQPAPISSVLAVDTWDGKASVSIRQGGSVRFLAVGDALGDAVLQRADADRQQVEFVTAKGAVVPLNAAAGAGQ